MAGTLVNFRMDEELKKGMEAVCKELGMPVTTAFVIFASKVVREKRIPFDVSIDPFYSEGNMAALRASVREAGEGRVVKVPLSRLEEMAR